MNTATHTAPQPIGHAPLSEGTGRVSVSRRRPDKHTRETTPKVSPWLVRSFTAYSRWYVGRQFHSVRIAIEGMPPTPLTPSLSLSDGEGVANGRVRGWPEHPSSNSTNDLPLVIYLNHASWWDPLICLLLQNEFFAPRPAFAPIDAAALKQYRFFSRLGFFGVEQHSPRGAAQFLRSATGVLQSVDSILWLTPQSRFADVRERPVRFKPGLGHLPKRIKRAAFVPFAIEYTHWEERKPEVLCRFGPVEIAGQNAGLRSINDVDWNSHFEQQLTATQDALAAATQQRHAADFKMLLKGRSGVGFIYDARRGIRAKLTGNQFRSNHGNL